MTRAAQSAALRRAFGSAAAWQLLRDDETSWVAGGCWLAAEALRQWLGAGEFRAIYACPASQRGCTATGCDCSRPKQQHVTIEIAGFYLDADGISTRRELADRWRRRERMRELSIGPFDSGSADFSPPAGRTARLVRILEAQLGSGRDFAAALAARPAPAATGLAAWRQATAR